MSKEIEEWRPIQGFEGLYEVSDWGRVKSLANNKARKEKILKGTKTPNGYLLVGLHKDGKVVWKLVHRLVAEAFLENPNNLPQVNHKDENKENNNVENFEWCTHSYNNNYGTRTERCSKRVDQIDPKTSEVVHQWKSTMEAGRNGFHQGAVANCCNGLRKTHKGFIWKYINS